MKSESDKIAEQAISPPPQRTTRKDIKFYPSGITLLNLCLGGGWGKGYVSNIVGWESTGKTMVACEALGFNHNNNSKFSHKFDNSESGFTLDTKYLWNFDINLIEPRSEKVEHFMFNVEETLKKLKNDQDIIYILDSLDGLSDDREEKKHKEDMKKIKKSIEEDTESNIKNDYSGKAKGMSQFFRQNNANINKSNLHLMITSQFRDKIGVLFGKKEERTGGKALNFYASQIVELKIVKKLYSKVTISGRTEERKVGNLIKALVTKNKLGKEFRSCFLFTEYDYGIDNIKSNIYFLYDLITPEGELRKGKDLQWNNEGKDKGYTTDSLIKYIEDNNLEGELEKRVIELWEKIEDKIMLKRKRKF